jgi:hypothetical protein
MTIKTNFDYIIATPDEQATYPHLIDTEQLNLEFVRLEFLDDDSTVSSYSDDDDDDDSTIESLDMEGGRVDNSSDDFVIPLAGSRRRERRTSRRLFMELVELESQLFLSGRRASPHRGRAVETNEDEDSVDLARRRVNRNGSPRYAGSALEEDSLRLTRTRVPVHITRHDQDDDEEDDYSSNLDFSMPLSSISRGSIIRRSSSSQKFQPHSDRAQSF